MEYKKMLSFERKYKAGEFGHRPFDDEAWEGLHGNLVRVYFDGTYYYYNLDIIGEVPTDEEQREIIDEVESMFYDQLYLASDNDRNLETPSKYNFENDSLYCFNIS
jgi:hypothetical protein